MRNLHLLSTAMLCASVLIVSCGSNKNGSENQATTIASSDTTPVNQEAQFKFDFAIGNLPNSSMVLGEISKAELPVNTALLNATDNVDKYATSLKQSFNFGIYGVDLGYLVVNSRLPEMLDYLSCTKKLADKLNLSETYNEFVNRFTSNRDNKDSLEVINLEAYTATEKYLKTNERLVSATEVLTGSWLEGQYLTVNLLKAENRSEKNEAMYERVYEQGLHLGHIIEIFNELKNDTELMDFKKDFDDLLTMYKELHSSKDVTKDYLEKLSGKITAVRSRIVN